MCLLAVETPSKPLTLYNRRYWRSYCLAICRAPLPFGAEIRWSKTVTQWFLLQKKYSHYNFTSRILGSIKSEFKATAQNHESIIKWDGKCDEFQGETWGSQITQKLVAGSIPQQSSPSGRRCVAVVPNDWRCNKHQKLWGSWEDDEISIDFWFSVWNLKHIIDLEVGEMGCDFQAAGFYCRSWHPKFQTFFEFQSNLEPNAYDILQWCYVSFNSRSLLTMK